MKLTAEAVAVLHYAWLQWRYIIKICLIGGAYHRLFGFTLCRMPPMWQEQAGEEWLWEDKSSKQTQNWPQAVPQERT